MTQAPLLHIFQSITRHIVKLTLYDMMQFSPDFEDVRVALNDRTDWSVQLFRSCLAIHLANGSYSFMLSALLFLVIAENVQIYYGRLSAVELKDRAEHMGYLTFALLLAVLDIGFIVVRVVGLVALSGSPPIAMGLVIVSMSPAVILPVLTSFARLLARRKRDSSGHVDAELGTVADKTEN